MRVVEIRSMNPNYEPKSEPKIEPKIEPNNEPETISMESDCEIVAETPKKRKISEVINIDDIPGPSGLPRKRPKAEPVRIESDSDSDREFFSYEPGEKEKKQKEQRFQADECSSALCPICGNYFDSDYIAEHSDGFFVLIFFVIEMRSIF